MSGMTRSLTARITLALFAGGLAACAGSSPEQQFVDDSVAALGGRDRVLALDTFVMEGTGYSGNLGQDMTWESDGQRFELSNVRRAIDLTAPRARTEQTRTPNFLYFRGSQPQQQTIGIDGDVAYGMTASGNAVRASETVARDRRIELLHHPLTITRAMLQPGAAVGNVSSDGTGRSAEVTSDGTVFTVVIDARRLPTRVSSPGYHPNLGDITITTEFGDYQDVDGLQLPFRLVTKIDDWTTDELVIKRYVLDEEIDLSAPASAASASPPSPAAPKVDVTQVAPGIWLLAGQSHHSALIEFADHLTLIEAPQSEARTLAVIARARELVPDKPLTELIVSHHHFDHSAGVRAAIAEGMRVITHRGNVAFLEEMARRPHTRQPDALQRRPQPVRVQAVEDSLTLRDAEMELQLYPIDGNPHAETMLMAYVPRHRVLIQADAYSPEGGTYHPYAANLLDNIRKRRLQVDRIVPLHGGIVPMADLVKTVSAQ